MSTLESHSSFCTPSVGIPISVIPQTFCFPGVSEETMPLHRIGEVRRAQSFSLATVARRLNIDIADARIAEDERSDMLLSMLYRWREVLDVPVSELLIDPDELPSNPIRNRGQLLRMMKTVQSILKGTKEPRIKLLAQTLADQMIELMPELEGVSAWPSVGQAREFKDYGQAVFRRFDSGLAITIEE
ncbi:MAG: hypothetical protein ACRC10_01670 [Thermoguttaceae bacterium]